MSEIKNGGLDQYGAEPFKQQQFRATGTKGVNSTTARGLTAKERTVFNELTLQERPPMKTSGIFRSWRLTATCIQLLAIFKCRQTRFTRICNIDTQTDAQLAGV